MNAGGASSPRVSQDHVWGKFSLDERAAKGAEVGEGDGKKEAL